ncbi:hypothetical protein [Rhizobium sp. R634]|uniref:hypothetical protein n=1 Tax=Rhizobium sp. R634 TaxID=1764274 RepID=UPI00167C7AFD|nr:hypothetical protein [Rhizobium sp. R634]
MKHLDFLDVSGLRRTNASHHHDSNRRRAHKLAHEFPPIEIGGGPSLPPDAFRHCGGRHTAALLRAVDHLKRYKHMIVKPFLGSREKYGYFAIRLILMEFTTMPNTALKFKTFSFADCAPG